MDLTQLALLALGFLVVAVVLKAILRTVKFFVVLGLLLFLMGTVYYGYDTVMARLPFTGAVVVEPAQEGPDSVVQDLEAFEAELDLLLGLPP